MSGTSITADELRKRLRYDADTGKFFRLPGRGVVAGAPAGRLSTRGYIEIELCGATHKAHRLAWLYVHGEFPTGVIDHKNGAKTDNRIDNLRDATVAQNAQNRRLGARGLGVSWSTEKQKWRANIKPVGAPQVYLGAFDTREEAQAAYILAKRRYHTHGCL
jgi:hypothetical protein